MTGKIGTDDVPLKTQYANPERYGVIHNKKIFGLQFGLGMNID